MPGAEIRTLEKGNIYFFYRPKIDVKDAVSGEKDIKDFYLLLGTESENRYRLILIGKEHLPKISKHEKFWGFVSKASRSKRQIKQQLKSYTYSTKTRGKRTEPPARPCGEGVYRIVRHKDHTHLIYALELPHEPDTVQKALRITEEGSFIISVKNPEKGQPSNLGLSRDQKVKFPKRLQEKFKDRKFVSLEPPDFLNYNYAEVLFIGASEDIRQELGISMKTERETEERADIFNALRLDKEEHPIEPLLEGEWA